MLTPKQWAAQLHHLATGVRAVGGVVALSAEHADEIASLLEKSEDKNNA